MQSKEELFKEYRQLFPSWSDEDVEKYAATMAEKYSTIKRGDNVVHLEYYGGLITLNEIQEIEESLKTQELELSRFDKNGVPYASIEDYILHIALFLGNPVVQNVLLGVGTNALWDTLKNTTFFIWKKLKLRHWNNFNASDNREKLNFGLTVKLDKNTSFDLKLDGDMTEELVLNAIDKTLDLLKSQKLNESPQQSKFYIFDKKTKQWTEVDKKSELLKKIQEQNTNGS